METNTENTKASRILIMHTIEFAVAQQILRAVEQSTRLEDPIFGEFALTYAQLNVNMQSTERKNWDFYMWMDIDMCLAQMTDEADTFRYRDHAREYAQQEMRRVEREELERLGA